MSGTESERNRPSSNIDSSGSTSNIPITPVDGFFSGLRTLARRLDSDLSTVGQSIDHLHSNLNSSDADGTYAKRFLQNARKEMKSVKSDVKIIHEDLKRRSSTVVAASELITILLDRYSERLESVETFMEKYGYVRPDIEMENESTVDPLIDKDSQEASLSQTFQETFSITANNSNYNTGDTSDTVSDISTPPQTSHRIEEKCWHTPRTPRLEDFGLSEYTVSLFTRNQRQNHGQGVVSKALFDDLRPSTSREVYESETPSKPLQPMTVVSSIFDHPKEIMCTPVSSTHMKGCSSFTNPEMRTPRPEDFGLSDQLLLQEREKKLVLGKKMFALNGDKAVMGNTESSYNKFAISEDSTLTPKEPSPKLKSFLDSGDLPGKASYCSIRGSEINKENVSTQQSPQTPEIPMLLTNRWEITNRSNSLKYLTESMTSSHTSSNTPECPKLQTSFQFAASGTDCLPPDISLFPTSDQTPPMPVLSSKRYFNRNDHHSCY